MPQCNYIYHLAVLVQLNISTAGNITRNTNSNADEGTVHGASARRSVLGSEVHDSRL